MVKPTRRVFLSWFAGAVAAATVASGCGDDMKKMEGTTVENPPDIQEALNKSSAGYETPKKKR